LSWRVTMRRQEAAGNHLNCLQRGESHARNLATEVKQKILPFGILRSRIRIPKLLVKEVLSGDGRGRFVTRRQPGLGPVRLGDVDHSVLGGIAQ
jgi:hypothetical protein